MKLNAGIYLNCENDMIIFFMSNTVSDLVYLYLNQL